jgi:2-C-methyl-D-erythritol 4-phosphate cytidylyltransferase
MAKFAVVLPAAGKSRRFADKNYKKPFAPMAGRAVWMHSAERFVNRDDVAQVILIVAAEDREEFNRKFSANVAILGIQVVEGGSERSDSVERALAVVSDEVQFIAIHDAARPCIADKSIDAVFAAAQRDGAAILATPVSGTLKRTDAGHKIVQTVDRTQLWEAQTPQVFSRPLLLDAYARRAGGQVTDDAQLVEQLGQSVTVVPGSAMNRKITTREDLKLAEQLMKIMPKSQKKGFSHPFANDDLWR